MADESYFKVLLPTGVNVNILTTAGADNFIAAQPHFISTNMMQIKQFRNMPGDNQRQILKHTYLLFGTVAENASLDAFSSISQRELDALVHHVNDVFSRLERWNGVLEDYNQELLDCLSPYMKHVSFVIRALDMGLMRVLAHLLCSSARVMPSREVTEAILCLVNNCRITLSFHKWDNQKIMKRLEATGILAQYIRCITQPSPHGDLERHLGTLDALMNCPALIKKKYKKGEPSGEVLQQVLAKKDGYKGQRDERVTVRLQNLEKIAGLSNASNDGTNLVGRSCRKCNKAQISDEFQMNLLVCSRCKDTYYCSKECQRADWKEHKKSCAPPVGKKKSQSGIHSTIVTIVQENYYEVMKEVVKVTQEQDVDKQDLILELDLYARDGSAPALRDPPEFTVGVTRDYIEGSRPAEPDWFWKGTDVYDGNINNFLVATRDMYQRITSHHLLSIVRSPDGDTGTYRLQLVTNSNTSLFSDEAFDAFSRAMNGDDSCLGQVFEDHLVAHIQAKRADEEKTSLLQNSDIQSLMATLSIFTTSDRYRQMLEEIENNDGEEE